MGSFGIVSCRWYRSVSFGVDKGPQGGTVFTAGGLSGSPELVSFLKTWSSGDQVHSRQQAVRGLNCLSLHLCLPSLTSASPTMNETVQKARADPPTRPPNTSARHASSRTPVGGSGSSCFPDLLWSSTTPADSSFCPYSARHGSLLPASLVTSRHRSGCPNGGRTAHRHVPLNLLERGHRTSLVFYPAPGSP